MQLLGWHRINCQMRSDLAQTSILSRQDLTDAGTTYQKGDCVTANSNTYICIADNVEGTAKSPANDPSGTYWKGRQKI